MTSAIPVQRSTNWANKPTGSWSWWWSVNPWSDEYTVKSIWKSYIFQATYMFMTLWPVWGYFRVDQPTSTCFKWHTSISVYLQMTLDCSNSHERRWSTRNLNDKHTIWRLINFFKKMTTRGEISLRDIAYKVTFFKILASFICLKHLLMRTLDVNIAKLYNIWFLSFVRELPL